MMRRDGHLAFAPNLQTASGADLGAQLGDALGNSRVFCENDANCATLAEHEWGAGRGISDFVMVTLGTGIGGGDRGRRTARSRSQRIRRGDRPHGRRGARRAVPVWRARVLGALRLGRRAPSPDPRRPPSTVACRRSWRAAGGDWRAVRAEDVTRAAAEGLDEAVALMREVGWWLALGLANLAAILDAGHFVIGGGLSEASDLVLPAAREYLAELVEGYEMRPTITVTTSLFGARSGAMGATLVAFEGA